MPVDLSPGGPPSPYPKRRLKFVSWIVIWALFCSVGACIALMSWPAGTPARGAQFWLCVLGAPNAAFLMVLGCARSTYETAHLRALYRNQHRQNWLHGRIAFAQKPLHVLAQSYLLPDKVGALATTVMAGKTIMATQSPRHTTGHVLHSRLPDIESKTGFASAQEENPSGENPDIEIDQRTADSQTKPDGFRHVITGVLAPLTNTLRALSLLGATYAPAVRLAVGDASAASVRLKHVQDVLSELGLSSIDCEVAAAGDGLMLVDQWLDAKEVRPLLVIAAEWYDAVPPWGSTEGGVAVLFGTEALLGSITSMGTFHRPVAVDLDNPIGATRDLAMSASWGKALAAEVGDVWITGFDPDYDKKLAAAFKNASFKSLAESSAIHMPDRIIGHAGSAAPWLAVAAAVESGAGGPQLILNQSGTAQSAILYTNPPLKHENRAETEED